MTLHMDISKWSILKSDWLYSFIIIIIIIFFTAQDGETLYSQQKQDLGLSVAQIIISLLQNSGLNWRK